MYPLIRQVLLFDKARIGATSRLAIIVKKDSKVRLLKFRMHHLRKSNILASIEPVFSHRFWRKISVLGSSPDASKIMVLK